MTDRRQLFRSAWSYARALAGGRIGARRHFALALRTTWARLKKAAAPKPSAAAEWLSAHPAMAAAAARRSARLGRAYSACW